MDENIEKLVAETEKSLADNTFVKLVLSNYRGADVTLQKISARIIETKKGARLMFQSRFETRDAVKNFTFAEAALELRRHLSSGFRNAHLFTTRGDFQFEIGKRSSRLTAGKPTSKIRPEPAHDRAKKTLIDPNAFYLKALGIATDKGEIKPSQQDKWRQINKFVEILDGLIQHSDLKDKPNLKIVDMGSGKGYLTFAAYDYLANRHPGSSPYNAGVASASADGVVLSSPEGSPSDREDPSQRWIQMTGVEQRPQLVDLCNQIAESGSFEGLKFVHGTIADFDTGDRYSHRASRLRHRNGRRTLQGHYLKRLDHCRRPVLPQRAS